jgi:hypothetical protein
MRWSRYTQLEAAVEDAPGPGRLNRVCRQRRSIRNPLHEKTREVGSGPCCSPSADPWPCSIDAFSEALNCVQLQLVNRPGFAEGSNS